MVTLTYLANITSSAKPEDTIIAILCSLIIHLFSAVELVVVSTPRCRRRFMHSSAAGAIQSLSTA